MRGFRCRTREGEDPNRHYISMQADGSIFISAGQTGNLTLSAGSSFISLSKSHIRIHADTVDITGGQINLN